MCTTFTDKIPPSLSVTKDNERMSSCVYTIMEVARWCVVSSKLDDIKDLVCAVDAYSFQESQQRCTRDFHLNDLHYRAINHTSISRMGELLKEALCKMLNSD